MFDYRFSYFDKKKEAIGLAQKMYIAQKPFHPLVKQSNIGMCDYI